MSLNQFLAVGRSFIGIRRDKSPFEMRKECLLPIFEPSPKWCGVGRSPQPVTASAKAPAMVQTEWLPEQDQPAAKVAPQCTPPTTRPAPQPPRRSGRSLLSILTFGLLGRGKESKALVQAELSLEKVRVLRNDLSDADLELVMKKRPQARKASAAASFAPPEGGERAARGASGLFLSERR